jgi:hypothetical protein
MVLNFTLRKYVEIYLFKSFQYYQYVEREITRTIEICGFISISDLTIPPTLSRHLLLPLNEGTIYF